MRWLALEDLGAERVDRKRIVLSETTIRDEPLISLHNPKGELKIVPEPAGTRGGYDNLRGGDTRADRQGTAPLGRLDRRSRGLAAIGREHDMPSLQQLRRLRELERGLSRTLER